MPAACSRCAPTRLGARPSASYARATAAPRRRDFTAARATAPEATPARQDRISYDHLLLTILDSNPDLSSSSWQAVATAADLATLHKGRVTVLVVDEQVEGAAGGGDQGKLQQQASKIANTLSQMGVEYKIVERQVVGSAAKDAEGRSSVVVGEVADEVEADLLVLHSQTVHNKEVDANLLAEFVSCPVLLLP
ncbi:MAG: hypothetical protein J3K34DRAFT_427183 [Monoraphidium minutum]|nr:MAG: hypothetical protein J3K34DRAFT_427183 [Monoraphidium minutum]